MAADPLTSVELSRRRVGDLTLEVAAAGPDAGPLAILLHGFPDHWQSWSSQIDALTSQGFRVLAPNQRGYGESDKPRRIKDYDIDQLAGDVLRLADSEGREKFVLVGHDWGGLIAWWTAALAPRRVRRVVTVNAPHPGAFQDYLWRSPTQLLRSSYAAFFQIPLLPEKMLAAFDFALLWRLVQSSARPGVFGDRERQLLTQSWSQSGSLSAMLNYYRAAVRRSHRSLERAVQSPMLMVFGAQDPVEEAGLLEASRKYCGDGCDTAVFADAHHWPHLEAPGEVNSLIQRFLC